MSNIICPNCWKDKVIKNWKSGDDQKYKCKNCWKNFIETTTEEIIPQEVIKKEDKIKTLSRKEIWEAIFDIPKYSKKYDFNFETWKDYHLKRSRLYVKKTKKV